MRDFYKKLIELRHKEKALVYGKFKVLDKKRDRFVYKRSYKGTEFIIECNLGSKPRKAWKVEEYELMFPEQVADAAVLQPYEARVYKRVK